MVMICATTITGVWQRFKEMNSKRVEWLFKDRQVKYHNKQFQETCRTCYILQISILGMTGSVQIIQRC